jgi:hypothetical protein
MPKKDSFPRPVSADQPGFKLQIINKGAVSILIYPDGFKEVYYEDREIGAGHMIMLKAIENIAKASRECDETWRKWFGGNA